MSRRLHQLTLEYESVTSKIETELRRLRKSCKHKDVVRTSSSRGSYLFMCKRCRSEEHGYYLHSMRFAHSHNIPHVSMDEFFNLRTPGALFLHGRDKDVS